MNLSRWFPTSLASRFALAAAGLAASALLLTSIASWWLINEQHQRGVEELAANERQFRAAAVGSDLEALAARMSEIAGSTILATGLVDSAGRETYLGPFLTGIRQINGIPVQVVFTDFQGTEIASNSGARFSQEQMAWLRRKLEQGRPIAEIFASAEGSELVALEPMVYPRTSSPEGAVLYKVNLSDIDVAAPMRLEWGERRAGDTAKDAVSAPVPTPAVFEHLAFRVQGADESGIGAAPVGLPILHILLIALTLFCVVVVAGLRLARLLTLDLQRLGAFSSRLIGSGLSSERAAESGSAEVSHLARSINDMLDRLNEQHMALLREREKLTRLTEVLQLADRKKDDFLAMLGHELRNPLAPIGAGAELLRRIAVDDTRVVRTSEVIARQVGHMTKIISDLLDVSRVTRGLTTLDTIEVELAEVVATGIEQVRPLIEARRHALATTMPQERIVVLADRARLVQVVSNVLTNAAKYTAEGGHISVTLAATLQEASIAVQDDGVGISPELMPEIFDLFTQGSRAIDRNQGGLGLGLALVKHLVGLHGGSIGATSDGLGHGSTFTVRLPRVAAPTQPPPRVPVPGHAAGRLHILVVDDNVDAAQSLAELLTLEGHTAGIAHDGPATLAYAARERVDAFILDIGLPGMDGTELARRLRGMPEADGALLIALTGYGQDADRRKSTQAGFDHHLVKPVDPELLRSLLDVRSPVLEPQREADS
ncbi:hybrid sensor histidine kinase/response regulator [Piscinibacter sp.]|uniref:hybrid sensor histidine kinase/response regulator n=1 Tax=Piscinibacter sp. TaxID=1903157 RepID=UPI002CB9CFAD|nr:ATP-binding protein [Albitalea sp.]HUG22197.1 ATP-binding protein [Albitalea sp.]